MKKKLFWVVLELEGSVSEKGIQKSPDNIMQTDSEPLSTLCRKLGRHTKVTGGDPSEGWRSQRRRPGKRVGSNAAGRSALASGHDQPRDNETPAVPGEGRGAEGTEPQDHQRER